MTRAGIVRLIGFLTPAIAAVAVLGATNSWPLFLLSLFGVLIIGIPVEMLYRRLATPEEQRRDLEDRVRNDP